MAGHRKTAQLLSAAVAVLLGAFLQDAAFGEIQKVEQGPLVFENTLPAPPHIRERLRPYFNHRSASFVDWDPNGGILIATRFGETAQLHHISEPLGRRKQLTFFSEPVVGGPFTPTRSPNAYLFAKDNSGDEAFQIYLHDLENGTQRMLTDGRSRNTNPIWSNHGTRVVFSSNQRDGVNADLYVVRPFTDEEPKPLFVTDGALLPLDFSPNDSRLLLWNYVSVHESYLYLASSKGGPLLTVGPLDQSVAYGNAAFSKDGKGVYATTDYESEYMRLVFIDLLNAVMVPITNNIPWDITGFDESNDRRYLAFVANQDGYSRLYVRDQKRGRDIQLPKLPSGQIHNPVFSSDSRQLAFTLQTPTSPADVYVVDLKRQLVDRWTNSEFAFADSGELVVPEQIHYTSFDGQEIPAFVYQPKSRGKQPVLIHIHGGPEAQYRPRFVPEFQFYAKELGYTVIAPNVRGSSGYGKEFLGLDNGQRREDAVKDIGALLDWIDTQPDLDSDHVVVSGASYGGYMVLSALMYYGERLRGGIDFMGISNFVSFLENTQPYRRQLRREEYGDERDPAMREFLDAISPYYHADKITRPVLIIQGLNDPRVPVSESEQMIQNLRKNGTPVWYLLAKDEGHGFTKKRNREAYLQTVADFLWSLRNQPSE